MGTTGLFLFGRPSHLPAAFCESASPNVAWCCFLNLSETFFLSLSLIPLGLLSCWHLYFFIFAISMYLSMPPCLFCGLASESGKKRCGIPRWFSSGETGRSPPRIATRWQSRTASALVLPLWVSAPTGTLDTGLDRTVLGLTWLKFLVGKACLHNIQVP